MQYTEVGVNLNKQKHKVYLPLASQTHRQAKSTRHYSGKHLKITRTFQVGKLRTANSHSHATPRTIDNTCQLFPCSEAHNTPPASPLHLLLSPESETPVDCGYQRRRTAGKTFEKTRGHPKRFGHGTVNRDESSNAAHVCNNSEHICERQHSKSGQSQTSHKSRAFSTCSTV